MPAQSSTFFTSFGFTRSSPMTARNDPPVKSETFDVAAFARSNDFGVNTTSGRVRGPWTCQRRRWKYDAGVEGIAQVAFTAQDVIRHELVARIVAAYEGTPARPANGGA